MSAIVTSVSWPTPVTMGTRLANIALATTSSLNGHRSSSEPPPRATIATSTPMPCCNAAIASAILPAASGPCTGVGASSSSASG